MATNRKKILLPQRMARAGWAVAEARDDVEAVAYLPTIPTAELHALLEDASAIALGLTPFGEAECAAGKRLEAVARIGVGYDTVDVPALTRHRLPLMVAGTANSVTVAEKAMFFMFALAKRGAAMDTLVRDNRWQERQNDLPIDLYGKTLLVVGFGRIGTRIAKRCLAMEMTVLVHDPYLAPETIRAAGCEPATDLDAAIPRADFITIHCPKNPETVGLFEAKRLARMKRSAYLVNTARGGIIDEAALHAALVAGQIAGAGIDVFAQEPPPPDLPLLKAPNLIAAPHMAGVTRESVDRMAVNTVKNLLSVLDGTPIRENAVNPEVF
jgi:D-3-phosphoglycerate dehydrogenase